MELALLFLAIPAGWILFIVVVAVGLWSILVSRPLDLEAIDNRAWRNFLGPLLVAAGIALLSIAILAPWLALYDTRQAMWSDASILPTGDVRRWTTLVGCAVPSVLVAATVGAAAVRRHLVTGTVFTFLVALGVAIAAMPFVLTEDVGAEKFCLDSCSTIIQSGTPMSGLVADVFYAWVPFFEPVPVAILAVGVMSWTAIVRARFTTSSQPESGSADAHV